MSDYTPSTDDVRDRWSLGHTKNGAHFTTDAFDRWLESVRAEERERIAHNIEERARRVAPAPSATRGGDYWTGLIRAARIAREGA